MNLPRRIGWLAASLCAAAAIAAAGGVDVRAQAPAVVAPAPAGAFDNWLNALRDEAVSRGITRQTVEAALGALERLPVVIERDRTQAELSLTLDQYLKRRLPARVVRTARQMAARHRTLLRKVERRYGVPGTIVTAVWGLESNFGRFTGTRPTIPALATLAYDGRRAAFFRDELFAALTIVDRGEIAADALKGSWAGAMGQPQFMPSNYLKDAVDFDGDGRRDIWASTADVLASIANYLGTRGWTTGQRWGREVKVSDRAAGRIAATVPLRLTGPCQAVRDMTEPRPLPAWTSLGVTLTGGRPLPASSIEASLVRTDRRTFLVYANYEALLAYNCAHTYALSVALLADRIH